MIGFQPRSKNSYLILLLLLIAGAIFPLGFAPIDWWPLPFISVAALYYCLHNASRKQAFWRGFWFGMGQFGVGITWVHVSIHEFGHAAMPLAIFLTLLFVVILSLFPAVYGYLFQRFGERMPWWGRVALFSVLWLTFELARGSGFVNFPWLFFGYSQMDSPLGGLIAVTGVHGVTIVGVVISALFAALLLSKAHWPVKSALLATLLIGSSLTAFISYETTREQSLDVALVQANVDQNKKWDPRYRQQIVLDYVRLSEPHWDSDLMIWSEAAIPELYQNVLPLMESLQERAELENSTLITGIPYWDHPSETARSSILTLGATPGRYDKQELVPFGEYVPLESVFRGAIEFFDLPASNFYPGGSDQVYLTSPKADLIPAICYEIAFPGLLLDLATQSYNDNEKLMILVTISNDAWFGRSWGPLQHLQMVQTRARELGIPVLRGTNNGVTAVIDHKGNITARLPQFEEAVLAKTLQLKNQPTIYQRVGFIPLWSMLGLLIIAMAVAWSRRAK